MKLQEYLSLHGLTEADFAERLGCARETVRRYCAGTRIPDRDMMPKVAAETGGAVTANDFFGIAA